MDYTIKIIYISRGPISSRTMVQILYKFFRGMKDCKNIYTRSPKVLEMKNFQRIFNRSVVKINSVILHTAERIHYCSTNKTNNIFNYEEKLIMCNSLPVELALAELSQSFLFQLKLLLQDQFLEGHHILLVKITA